MTDDERIEGSDPPNIEQVMERLEEDGGCEATDGYWTEPGGHCEHGCPSWALGEVPPLAEEGVWQMFRENFPRLQSLQRWALVKLVGSDVLDAFRGAAE